MDVSFTAVWLKYLSMKWKKEAGGGNYNGNSLSICWLNNKSSIFVPKTPNHYNGEKGFMNFLLSMK